MDTKLALQNRDVAKLVRGNYDLGSLEALRQALARKRTLRLRRYRSGGASAISPIDFRCWESALHTRLFNMWDRDSIFQALAELAVALDSDLANGLRIPKSAWKKGLFASIKHHWMYRWRFTEIISWRRSGFDYSARPNIRYNAADLLEITDAWGHAQNDSLGFINFMQFYCLNRNNFSPEDAQWQKYGVPFASLLHNYFWTIRVWEDFELGAWEDRVANHASSVGVVLASLREQAKFLETHKHLHYKSERENRSFEVTLDGVNQMIEKCETALKQILPNEFVRSDNGDVRTVDAALVNALFLSALSCRPLVDDAMTVTIIDNIERELMGHIGISRYEGDIWDGLNNRHGIPKAQWSHVSPMISFIFGEMYQRTGDKKYYERQLFHFNRAVGCVNSHWRIPEAYIIGEESGEWESDANISLAWAQAATIFAFKALKASLKFQCKPCQHTDQ